MPRTYTFNDHPFAYHQELELEITTLTNLGLGIGRYEGWVVMVPFTLPDERVRVRIWRNHKSHSEADLVEVLRPSPRRVKADCPLFTICSGCQYQHMDYREQLEWKRRHVADALERIGGIQAKVESTLPSPMQYGYRSKLTPHYRRPSGAADVVIGFLRQDRRGLVDVHECPIATDAINTRLRTDRNHLKRELASRRFGGTLLFRESDLGVTTNMREKVIQTVGSLQFEFQAGEFFQNNPFILPAMITHVIEQAHDPEIDYLVDVYCGAGMFALAGAGHFRHVAGIEVNQISIRAAEANRIRNGVENCRFIEGSAESIFAHIDFPANRSAVILDPPRRGCDNAFLNQLVSYAPKRIVYVSCDPATQARDVKVLCEHGYKLVLVQPMDLFPQTRHIECAITLEHDR